MLRLLCHPETPALPIKSVEAALERRDDGHISISYNIECAPEKLDTGQPEEAVRTDGLWKETCLELFLRKSGSEEYIELNFAPSSQWAAYRFSGYREGMAELSIDAPKIALASGKAHFMLKVGLELPRPWSHADLDVAIAAVLKENDGTTSYWALKHAKSAPDFHYQACFTHKLKAATLP